MATEDVDGFPTLMLYKDGDRVGEYTGGREERLIIDYISRNDGALLYHIGSVAALVPNLAQLEAGAYSAQGILGIALGVFLPRSEPSPVVQRFENIAEYYEASLFYESQSKDVIEYFRLQRDAVIIYSGERHDVYHTLYLEDDMTEQILLEHLMRFTLPLSLPFSAGSLPILQSLPVAAHALAFYDATGTDDAFLDALMDVMVQYKGQVQLVEVSSEEYSLVNHFQLRLSDLPQLIIVDRTKQVPKRYSFADYLALHGGSEEVLDPLAKRTVMKRVLDDDEQVFHYNSSILHSFFTDYLQNNLSPSLWSENASAVEEMNAKHQPSANVRNIVGSQFEEIFHPEEIALVYFHAPWCIHCKVTEVIVGELADQIVTRDPSIKVYRMDGQKNEVDHPDVAIVGFPTIYYFHSNKKAVLYEGERSLSALFKFVTSSANEVGVKGEQNEGEEAEGPGNTVYTDIDPSGNSESYP